MNTQTETQPQSKPPEYAKQTKLAIVYFQHSVPLPGFGELDSAAAWPPGKSGHRPGNTVDFVAPAWLLADGSVSEKGDGPPHGFVLRKKHHDLTTGKRVMLQAWVPMQAVRGVAYGE